MNQAILKIIDEMIEVREWYSYLAYPWWDIEKIKVRSEILTLHELRDKISSLPSDTQWIDTLQRYNVSLDWWEYNNDNWEYVKYSDVMDLLNR